MTDQEKREKVIKGLECCMSGQPDGLGCSRVPCPYNQFGDCEGILHRDALALLKAQEQATIEPKRIDLADETKAWLDKMDAVDALENIANICIDWDGYRTADGLGGLINEIWAYSRYCADRLLKAQEPITGETSDGYHTFNELYHHRAVLFSVIVANYKDRAWKSVRHHDGTMYDGMFIVGIDTPDGQATYHYDIDPYWDMFNCKVLEFAPEWDGHTPAQAIERIGKLKAQEPRVMTLEELWQIGDDSPVWIETAEPVRGIKPAIFQPNNSSDENGDGFMCVVSSWGKSGFYQRDRYNRDWRCWTSRPTDAQREATLWE